MVTTNDDRPLATLDVIWRQYRALALTARGMKAAQKRASICTLALASLGGFLSTLAGVIGGKAADGSTGDEGYAALMGLLAAVAIGLAGYLGKELLSPTREDEWVRCRALAEALKSDVYKALVRVKPYDGSTAGAALRERVETLLHNSGLELDAAVMQRTDDKKLPSVSTIDEYIALRVRDQLKFYASSAGSHQKQLRRYRTLTLVLGAAAAVMSIVGAKEHGVALWVPVVTTVAAALTTFIQSQRLQGLVPLYQRTSAQLELALASWADGGAARGSLPPPGLQESTTAFVNRCEEILGQESEAWRAEWQAKDKGNVEAFVKQLAESQGKKGP